MRCVDFRPATIIYSFVPIAIRLTAEECLPLVPLITMMFGFGLVATVVLALGIKQIEHRERA